MTCLLALSKLRVPPVGATEVVKVTAEDAFGAARGLARREGVTEGVATAPALVARAEAAGVEMPLCKAVAALVTGRLTLVEAMDRLLSRPRKMNER